jgi:hypothetical protein
LEALNLRVPARYIGVSNVFSSSRNYPADKCALAVNVVIMDVKVVRIKSASIKICVYILTALFLT